MIEKNNPYAQLKLIITEQSFYVDDTLLINEQCQKIAKQFSENRYKTLYEFALTTELKGLSASVSFMKKVADAFFQNLIEHSELELAREQVVVLPTTYEIEELLNARPFAIGSEYINEQWITIQFKQLNDVFADEIKNYQGSVQMYLAEKSQNLSVAQRIYFHLVDDEDHQFAFMATYATKDEEGHIRHLPLKNALKEYAEDRKQLIALLSCLNKAAEVCETISSFMSTGEMFHPIQINEKEAYDLLVHVKEIENCGIMCRVPNWWKKKYASVNIQVKIGEEKPSLFGFDSLMTTKPSLVVNGVSLTADEINRLLKSEEGLVWMKGQWIEVNHRRLKTLLEQFSQYEGELTFKEALQHELADSEEEDDDVQVTNGEWLNTMINRLKNPQLLEPAVMPKAFNATLRSYQESGYSWLSMMGQLGFGACLADDMGLGKTIQVLAFLQKLMETEKQARVLLVVPASLLGNWSKEIEKFTPEMDAVIVHAKSALTLNGDLDFKEHFLTITTYGIIARNDSFSQFDWTCVILDEAQAIKNPKTKQTKVIKTIPSRMRIALTGTPIENDLSNLWSLFDFLNSGLLGSLKEFQKFGKSLTVFPERYDKLRTMIAPFILRRMKTDKKIISDLPDKVEMNDYVELSKRQIVQYHHLLEGLEEKLNESSGMERRGLILATLTKLKQICNHPDQYVHDTAYLPKESGKFEMLRELCETIYEKRERVLVFTQYKEICEPLSDYLESIFHKRGHIIHGGTSVKMRNKIVDLFNGEEYCPYIVLSIRAAGTGLNLVSANHVIHFDRWWNPAVENQATDRAFRIGQKKNVFVHKLICRGTVEEKIDQLINSKKALAESIIPGGKENWITELDNRELMSLFRLDN